MAIYLDTNVMRGWLTFREPDRLALAILASELQQVVVVPSLVAEELDALQRRRLQEVASQFKSASDRVKEFFNLEYVQTEPVVDVEMALDPWRASLAGAFESCTVTADDALEGLRREISGTPPARRPDRKGPGIGGRDAAIWAAVARDHAVRGEPGHFVTGDKGFWDGSHMSPRLIRDLADAAESLTLHASIKDALVDLGVHHDFDMDTEQVRARALPLIVTGLEHSRLLPSRVFSDDFQSLEFRTEVTSGAVEHVDLARRFSGNLGDIILVDATWKLEFRVLYRPLGGGDGLNWYVMDDLDARGPVQVYLTQAESRTTEGQFIAAQLQPRQEVFVGDELIQILASDTER